MFCKKHPDIPLGLADLCIECHPHLLKVHLERVL